MPSPNPTTRREYRGAAKATTLSAQIVNGSDTSFTITDATNWPTGVVGKFVVTINAGQTDEEKILCSTRSGTTVNVDTRGYDSTAAAGHAAGATAVHTISALDADEWNQHTAATSGVHGVVGNVVGTTDTQTITNKTFSGPAIVSPAITGTVFGGAQYNNVGLDASSTHGGVSGTTLAADRTAWTAYAPTVLGADTETVVAAYKLIGKTLHLRIRFTAGTGNVGEASPMTMTLPAALSAVGTQLFAAPHQGSVKTWTASGTTLSVQVTDGVALSGSGITCVIEVS